MARAGRRSVTVRSVRRTYGRFSRPVGQGAGGAGDLSVANCSGAAARIPGSGRLGARPYRHGPGDARLRASRSADVATLGSAGSVARLGGAGASSAPRGRPWPGDGPLPAGSRGPRAASAGTGRGQPSASGRMRTTRVRRSIPSPRSTAPACPPTPCACGAGGADDGRRRSPRCPPPPGSSACRGGRPTPRAGRRGPPRPRPARGGPPSPAGGRAPVRRGSLGQPPSASRGRWSGASLGRRTWRRWTKASGSASRGAALGPACSSAATSTTPGRPRSREPGGKSSRDGRPSRSAGSTASARRRPSRSIPTAIGTARPPTTPASRTFPHPASRARYADGPSGRRPADAART